MKAKLSCCVLTLSVAVAAHADVYVSQVPQDGSAPSILVFASDAVGDAAPIRVIGGPNTGLVAPYAITTDPVNNELYVSDFFGSAVHVYPLDADGDIAPLRSLVDGPNSLLVWPRQLVVDTANDQIIVPSFNIFSDPTSSIRTYPRTADGDVAPVRSLFGDATLIDNPISIVLDPTHDEIITDSYSAGGAGIAGLLAFARTADGDVAPSRAITSDGFGGYTNFLAFDPVADELYSDYGGGTAYAVFPRTANGDIAPARVVTGVETGIYYVSGIAYDAVNQRVIVLSFDQHDGSPPAALNVYNSGDSGNVVPLVSISGPHTQLVAPAAVAIDGGGGFSGIGARVYKVEDDFNNAVSDPGSLVLEDFEGGAAAAGDVIVCNEPLDRASNDDCFMPGQLVPGFDVRSSSGAGVAAVGSGFFGNASTAVGAVFVGDSTIVEFGQSTTTFAMDVFLYDGGDSGRIDVALYDADGNAIGYSNIQPAAGETQTFVGVIAPAPVARIELKATVGGAFIDNLRFNRGDEIFADGFDGA
jgi:hypothetical protein